MKTMLAVLCVGSLAIGQPRWTVRGVKFIYCKPARSVVLAGDFNSWQKEGDPLVRDSLGCWSITKMLSPGLYQYKFFVDEKDWMVDDANPARVPNYNNSGENSVLVVNVNGSIALQTTPQRDSQPSTGEQFSKRGTLYLNIIWHQHQPLYLDPGSDQLKGPWVRTHGTKDYYDMAAVVEQYPDIHFNVNLTSSLLFQLDEYYVKRLRPFVDLNRNRVDAGKYFKAFEGKTDPWIDLALRPTNNFTAQDLQVLLTNAWNAFGISDIMIGRFPEYKELREKAGKEKGGRLSEQELREIKFWFYLAYFDPDFFDRPVTLANGLVVDVTDLIRRNPDSTYTLKKRVSEDDCNRIVAEAYKILSAIVPVHKKLLYHSETQSGQIEVITTPFYHPILPLLYDSDLAKICQPKDTLPRRFHYPEDAEAQVAKAAVYYESQFGIPPSGMWPGEGAVAHDILPVFVKQGIRWIATDEKNLARSRPPDQPKSYPYALSPKDASSNSIAIVFRDTRLSDKIGFVYQSYHGEEAAEDFVRSILVNAPAEGEADRLLTVILDGENAWEWYRYDNDGKEFLRSLYRKLSELYRTRRVVTVTTNEYIQGNAGRNVPAHPLTSMRRLEWLWPGSWINSNFDTWIGEREENRAWEYLRVAREDLERSGLKRPDPKAPAPESGTAGWPAYRAWESLYAAEGSDWFWWYGDDQGSPTGDKPFDIAFITHLSNIYRFAQQAGAKMPARTFAPIIRVKSASK